MLRVQLQDLKDGMILAEPILDISGKVLLADKAVISQKHIQIMQTWDIGFIHIREDGDTDESIASELKEEQYYQNRIVNKSKYQEALELGITADKIISILQGTANPEQFSSEEFSIINSTGTLFNEQVFDDYMQFLNIIEKTFQATAKNKELLVKESVELAQLLSNYILCTEGVIGYALR